MNISVIIPTYNEENQIQETINAIHAYGADRIKEILVVDGGSTDNTISVAKATGAKIKISPKKGRAAQMNYGAEQACGDILYFLHADSIPPSGFAKEIRTAVAAGSESGCFRLAFDEDHPLLDFYAWFTQFDVDAFRFGDQSLFILSEVFSTIGGFREDHIVMEDNEIVRRIKADYKFSILEDKVKTSARTYREVGIIKLQFIFALIYFLYFLGVAPETLSHIRKNAIS